MLTIQDLLGNEEGLTDFKGLSRNRKVNGEKTLSLTLLPTKNNAHSFSMVEEESIITFDNEEYVIKKLSERGIGNTYLKQSEAVHKFFIDMINKQQPKIQNGSMTFSSFLQFVFEGTGYTFSIIDTFYAQSFENLGNDNRLALLQKGLERYKAELQIVGKDIRFKKKIGNDTDFQFRYAHNVKTIEKNVDTTNLATVINGTGAEGITAYYRSPNADIFGELEAPPVEDERFTTQESLLEEMKSSLEDTPEFSITIDFADLRAAGYPYTVPNEGDKVFVIYEPMNDLLIETRIMEVTEEFDANLKPIKTKVTLANYKKTFAGTMFDNIQKQLGKIINADGVIKYDVLDEAVKVATEALQSAQTELEFNNGIIAREKIDPNRLVLFNSAGLGISTDGGNTFNTAMTADGIVAERIVGGSIIGVNLASANEDGMFHVNGADAEFLDLITKRNVKISPDGLFGYNSDGSERFRVDRLLVTSAALGTSNSNVYLAPDSTNEVRVVDVSSIPSDGVAENYSYRPIRALGLRFGPYANGYIGTEGEVRITSSGFTQEDGSVIYRNVHAAGYIGGFIQSDPGFNIYAGTDGEFRVTSRGMANDGSIIYRDIRANAVWAGHIASHTGNMYVGSDDEVRITSRGGYNGGSIIYRNLRANGVFSNSVDVNGGTNLYLRPTSGGEVRATATGTTSTYVDLRAANIYSNGNLVTSDADQKKNITDYTGDALAEVNTTPIREYHLLKDLDTEKKRLGIIMQEAPADVVDIKGYGVDTYAMIAIAWKAIQQLSAKNAELEQRVSDLETVV